jgi:hypothetical protein
METVNKCVIHFNNKYQSDDVVVGSEESVVALSPEIAAKPSFALT